MSLTFAELNNIVDFNIHEWAKTIDSRVIIIKNTGIPEKVGELSATISYQGYDANPTNLLAIRKFTKSEKEVINLIDKSISVANKLINTVCQLEKEVNE